MRNNLEHLDDRTDPPEPPSIDLDLSKKLKGREYRQKYFLAEASARIAEQLIALRRRRQLNQTQVAELVGTHQPAISRAEKADYHSWSFNTLRGIADALDARLRVNIEPSEDVLHEYESQKVGEEILNGDAITAAAEASRTIGEQSSKVPLRYGQPKTQLSWQQP
jgi:transcriptional regulator with XRE-family HTH domain